MIGTFAPCSCSIRINTLTTKYCFLRMYQGFTVEGIDREIRYSLECATMCRSHNRRSLAIPATALLHMASLVGPGTGRHIEPDAVTVARGIRSALLAVVAREVTAPDKAVPSALLPDSHQDPSVYTIDPYGRYGVDFAAV
jgi:hypothetical protein